MYNTQVANAFIAHRGRYFAAEAHCFASLLGDSARGKLALDLGCGTGLYSRYLVNNAAASHVIGLDLSESMLQLAQAEETKNPTCKIHYVQGNVADLGAITTNLPSGLQPPFAVIVAAFVLQHLESLEKLTSLLRIIRSLLAPGGKLIAGVNNPPSDLKYDENLKRYGLYYSRHNNLFDGKPIGVCFVGTDGEVEEAVDYYYSNQAYAQALHEAGFVDIVFSVPHDPPPSTSAEEVEYLKAYFEWPSSRFFCATNPTEEAS